MATIATNKKDLRMDQGKTWITQWQVKDHGLATPTVVDITGATAFFTAKYDIDDADVSAVFKKSVGSGITLTDPTNGKLTVQVNPTDTSLMTGFLFEERRLYYDFTLKTVGGEIYAISQGDLVVRQNVTLTTT
jgi:hypothetical protein